MNIQKIVLGARAQSGLSMRKAAKLLGISNPGLCQIETGVNDNPRLKTLQKIARGYGIKFIIE